MTPPRPLAQTSPNLAQGEPARPRPFAPTFREGRRASDPGAHSKTPDLAHDIPELSMATIDASTTPAPITCRSCGRPLLNAVSRVLGLGSHCRSGLTERQLVDELTGSAVPADPRSSRAPRVTVNAVTSGTVVA